MSKATSGKEKWHPQDLYLFLREEILSQRLEPGASLFERMIAEQHGLSRTPVREALLRLEAEGLVKRYPKMGMVVAELSLRDVMESFQIRQFIEPPAAAEAAKKLRPEPLRELLEQFEAMGEPTLTEGHDEELFARHNQLDTKMHDLILAALGNRRLMDLMDNMRSICRRARNLGTPIRFAESREEHIAILKALLAGDSELARQTMNTHLENTRHRLILAV